MANVNEVAKRLIANVEEVIISKRQEIILALVAFFCEGHILLGRLCRKHTLEKLHEDVGVDLE